MSEEVSHGTKTKDEEDPIKRPEDETNCYEKNDNLLSHCSI